MSVQVCVCVFGVCVLVRVCVWDVSVCLGVSVSMCVGVMYLFLCKMEEIGLHVYTHFIIFLMNRRIR